MEFSQDHAGHNLPPLRASCPSYVFALRGLSCRFALCCLAVEAQSTPAVQAFGRRPPQPRGPRAIREAFDPRQASSAARRNMRRNAGSRRAGGRAAICKRSAGRSRRDRPGGRLQRGGRCASCGSGGGHCAACGSAPAFGVGCTGAFGCVGTCDRLWFRGDFLMWWTPRRTCRRWSPPARTTPQTQAGVLGSGHKRPLRKRG